MINRRQGVIHVLVRATQVVLTIAYVASITDVFPDVMRPGTLPLLSLFLTLIILVAFQVRVAWQYEGSLWPPGASWRTFRWVMAYWFLSLLLIIVYALIARYFGSQAVSNYIRWTIWYFSAFMSIWFLGKFLALPRDPEHIAVHEHTGYMISTDGIFGVLARAMPIIVADSGGVIRYTTETLDDLIGAKKGELYEKNLVTIMPERYRELHLAGLRRYLDTGESHILRTVVPVEMLCRNGEEKPVHLALTSAVIEGEPWFVGALWPRDLNERDMRQDAREDGLDLRALGLDKRGWDMSKESIRQNQQGRDLDRRDLEG